MIAKLDESIEHLWDEIQGRKKNYACVIGIFYQPSSENNKKIEWIEKPDSVLSIVKSTWSGTIIIAGGSNIDLYHPKSKNDTLKYLKLMI